MTFIYFLSWFATFNNILFFSTGIVTCKKIIHRNSTDNVNHLPFLMTAFCCFMWTLYGLAIRDSTVSFVNVIGMMMQSSYLLCYFIYSKSEPVFKHTMYIVLFSIGLVSYLKIYIVEETESISKMGLACVIITVIMFGSPLATLKKIFQTRSTETLSFPLSVMTVMNSTAWMTYGFLISDNYVVILCNFIHLRHHNQWQPRRVYCLLSWVPNVCGLSLGLIQCTLFCIFPNKSPLIVSL